MFWGININMKMVLGSVSVNYDRLLSDLAWFSLIFCRKRFLGGFYLPAFVEGTHESSRDCSAQTTSAVSECSCPGHGIELNRPEFRGGRLV